MRTIRLASGPVQAAIWQRGAIPPDMVLSGPGDHRTGRHDDLGGTGLDRAADHRRRIVTGALAHDRSDHHRGDPTQAGRHRQRDAVHAAAQFVFADRQGRARRLGRVVHRGRADAGAGLRDPDPSRDIDPGAATDHPRLSARPDAPRGYVPAERSLHRRHAFAGHRHRAADHRQWPIDGVQRGDDASPGHGRHVRRARCRPTPPRSIRRGCACRH